MRLDHSERLRGELRAEMARRSLSQTAIAVQLGETQGWVSKRLTGRVPLTVDDLSRFADVLNLPVSALMLAADQQPAAS
jgi:transcriptional regulator with XRE-family HTH domain